MRLAIEQAQQAEKIGEVPIGAVLVRDGAVIAVGRNTRETAPAATGHAEIMAIDAACKQLNAWRLSDCTLYVTLEPCLMCAGAIYQARIARVVFGAHDPKAGATGSLFNIHEDKRLNHNFEVQGGVLGSECGTMLKEFFAARRQSL